MAIHYTCDMCNNPINLDREVRFDVTIEVTAAYDTHDSDPELAAEHELEDEVTALFDLMDQLDGDQVEGSVYRHFTFHLCNGCRKRFVKDPLNRQSVRRLGFSEN